MANGEERQQRSTEVAAAAAHDCAAAAHDCAAATRVLAVDDDRVSLKVLEVLLRRLNYHVTTAMDAEAALQMLRERRGQFDLVITDVRMPGMDGFKLLEIIGLEMDIPVIMLSADEEKETMVKGITCGACDYLVKPVQAKELKNIWRHVIRRRAHPDPRSSINGGNGATDYAQRGRRRARSDEEDGPSEQNELPEEFLASTKKPRVTWTKELHQRFLYAINLIGIDNAAPKNVLQTMNVSYITRDSVASHLQRYRLYLKKVSGYTGRRSDLHADDASESWSSNHTMTDQQSYKHHHEHGRSSGHGKFFTGLSSSPLVSSHGMSSLHSQPFQLRNASSSLTMAAAAPGGSMLRDASNLPHSGRRADDSFASISEALKLDDDDEFPSYRPGNSFTSILRHKLLEASNAIPRRTRKSPEKMPIGAAMSVPVNNVPMQASMLNIHPRDQMYGTLRATAGDCSRSRQTMVPIQFADLGTLGGSSSSQVNIPNINQMVPTQMLNRESVSSILPAVLQGRTVHQVALDDHQLNYNYRRQALDDQIDNNNQALQDQVDNRNKAPEDQLDCRNQAIDDQLDRRNQAVDDQLKGNDDFLAETDASLDEMVASFFNQDFMQDGAFMDGDYWID